jgi:hypothetical protein
MPITSARGRRQDDAGSVSFNENVPNVAITTDAFIGAFQFCNEGRIRRILQTNAGRRLHAHEEVFPALDPGFHRRLRDGRRERSVIPSTMPNLYDYAPDNREKLRHESYRAGLQQH